MFVRRILCFSFLLCFGWNPMSSLENPISTYFPSEFLQGLTQDLYDNCEEEALGEKKQIAENCLKQPWENAETISENHQNVCDSMKVVRSCVNNFLQNFTDCTTEKMKKFGSKLMDISEIMYGAVCDNQVKSEVVTEYLMTNAKCQVEYHQLLFICLYTYVKSEVENSRCKNYNELKQCVKDNDERMDFDCPTDKFWKIFNIQAEAVKGRMYGDCPEISINDEMPKKDKGEDNGENGKGKNGAKEGIRKKWKKEMYRKKAKEIVEVMKVDKRETGKGKKRKRSTRKNLKGKKENGKNWIEKKSSSENQTFEKVERTSEELEDSNRISEDSEGFKSVIDSFSSVLSITSPTTQLGGREAVAAGREWNEKRHVDTLSEFQHFARGTNKPVVQITAVNTSKNWILKPRTVTQEKKETSPIQRVHVMCSFSLLILHITIFVLK